MAIWMRVRHRLPGADGLEVVAVNAIGVVVMALSVVAVAIAIGLVTRHALARWAAVLIFSGIAVGTLTALAAADAHHAEPASLLVASTAVLALVLSAPTRHDFHTTTSATMSG
jgi:hypothetical protein